MPDNLPADPESRIQSAFLRIFKVATRLPAQALVYASALGAAAYVLGPVAQQLGLPTIPVNLDWKPALDLIAGTVGANILSSLLLQLAQGSDISDDEIRQQIKQAVDESGISQLLAEREFQRAISRLLREQNHLGYLIRSQEYTIAEKLIAQYAQYEALVEEMQGSIATIRTDLQTLSTRQQSAEIISLLQYIIQLQESERHVAPRPPDPDVVSSFLERLATQQPYSLWDEQAYIDRAVALVRDEIFFMRYATRFYPHTTNVEERLTATNAKPEPLETVLAHKGKLVLLGEPGIGKTTSLLHLVWETAKQALATKNIAIPIYVDLKQYNGESELETLLACRVNSVLGTGQGIAHDLAESTRVIKAWLAQPDAHFLFLFDGLNEVRPEFYETVRDALVALLNSPHHVIITCREHDYDRSLQDCASAYVLQELREDDILDYLRRALVVCQVYLDGLSC